MKIRCFEQDGDSPYYADIIYNGMSLYPSDGKTKEEALKNMIKLIFKELCNNEKVKDRIVNATRDWIDVS